MSDPYSGTVNCHWCHLEDGFEMPAVAKAGAPFEGKFACRGHTDLLLISGLYGGPLPKMDEAMIIMQAAREDEDANAERD